MTQEALKLALEAHKKNERHNTVAETRYWCDQYKLLAEQALAQPEQEPVAWVDPATLYQLKIGLEGVHLVYETEMVNSLPLYDKPQRTWVGLTDEEYAELAEEFGPFPINQIEAKLKEKNT